MIQKEDKEQITRSHKPIGVNHIVQPGMPTAKKLANQSIGIGNNHLANGARVGLDQR